MPSASTTSWLPDFVYRDGRFESGKAIVCDDAGRVIAVTGREEDLHAAIQLAARAVLPGLVNAHSHAFQRAIRGRTENRTAAGRDTFWTWREAMYHAAVKLSPEDIYHVARMAFLEMLLSGITTVGEFHYLHHAADGVSYEERNLLAHNVVRAAHEVGLRIALQRTAYVRAGWNQPPNPLQARFITPRVEDFIRDTDDLHDSLAARYASDRAWVSVAPHSIRAVPLEYLREVRAYANQRDMKVHMHVAEQPAEIQACEGEYGERPFQLLRRCEILDASFTAIHAVHITDDEIAAIRESAASICACPTTERNLGDGIGPNSQLASAGVPFCFGTDSNVQIDLLEDARQLEYHQRLRLLERAVLAPDISRDGLAARLFDYATQAGAKSVGAPAVKLEPGGAADFFAVDLNDPAIAGASPDALLSNIVFSGGRAAIREVFVGGKMVVSGGRHALQEEITGNFAAVQRKLWGAA
jgi:formimidoylglutamate deiminase